MGDAHLKLGVGIHFRLLNGLTDEFAIDSRHEVEKFSSNHLFWAATEYFTTGRANVAGDPVHADHSQKIARS